MEKVSKYDVMMKKDGEKFTDLLKLGVRSALGVIAWSSLKDDISDISVFEYPWYAFFFLWYACLSAWSLSLSPIKSLIALALKHDIRLEAQLATLEDTWILAHKILGKMQRMLHWSICTGEKAFLGQEST